MILIETNEQNYCHNMQNAKFNNKNICRNVCQNYMIP